MRISKGVNVFNFQDFINKILKTKSQKRIPGNIQKRMMRRRISIPSGYTIARTHTQEFKRIIAASKGAWMSHNPNYGSKGHLKFLKALFIKSRIRQLKSEGKRVV